MPYGRTTLGTTGYPVTVLATDIEDTEWKVGGITLDWSTIVAVVADTTLLDGNLIKAGQKFLRFGQILCRSGVQAVQTWTWTGGPTGGGAIIRMPAFAPLNTQYDTTSIAFNATAAQFEAAVQALPSVGGGNVAVSRTGTGIAGDPYIYTLAFNRALGNVPAMTATSNTFTGGTTPAATPAVVAAGSGTGLYGPYDPAAGDGRQTLVRGACYILNETDVQFPTIGWGAPNADNPGVFDGGVVWRDRLLVAQTGAHSLAAGPTVAEFEAAFPDIHYVDM